MKLNRVFWLLSFLFVVMFAGNAFAALLELPKSNYQDGQGVAWEGESTYSDNGFHVLVQYAVYDKELGGNEWVARGYEAPGDGRYIYAYQVINYPSGTQDIGYLKLFGAEGSTLTGGEIIGIGSQKDDTTAGQLSEQGQGKKPFSGEFDETNKEISWKFLNFGGDVGVIGQGQHSYFLIYSSNNAPVMGNYEIKPPQSEILVPTPEPATIVLLGAGGLILIRKLRKQV